MMHRYFFLLAALCVAPVAASIGDDRDWSRNAAPVGIGAPGPGYGMPVQVEPPPPAEKPLMVIRFQQPRIDFDHALRQAVISAERTRAGIVYTVVAVQPAAMNWNQAGSVVDSQKAVVDALNAQGIPPSRIRVSRISDSTISSPEVRIFVN